jgi:hypothetical protein
MRPLKRLFFPGSASGFVFTMVWGTILLVGAAAALYFDLDLAAVRFHAQGWQLGTYNGLIVLGLAWVFLFFYASLGLCLSVFEFRPQVVRVLMLSLIILANLAPVIFVSIESLNREKRRPSMNGYFISQGVCVISALTPPGRMLEGGSARSDDWVIPPPEAVFGSDYVSLFTAVPWVRRGESPSPHRMALPQYMVGGGAYLFLGCLLLGFAWGRYRRRLRHALAQEAREREAMESGPSDPPRATTEMTGPGSSGSEADEEPRDGPTGHETEPRPG